MRGVINAYGTTEGGPLVFDAHPDGLTPPTGSVGYPHAAVEVRLRGPEGRPNAVFWNSRAPPS